MKNLSKPSSSEMNIVRQEALDFAGIGLYRYTFEGIILFIDKGALRIMDLEKKYPDPSMLIGKNISDLLIYVGPKGLLREQIRQHRHLRNFEYPFQTLSGNKKWALHNSYLVRNLVTGEELIQVIILDITERKIAEEKLKVSQERYKKLTETAFEGIAIHEKGIIVEANQALADMFGYELSELIGKNGYELAAPESRAILIKNVEREYDKSYQAIGLKKDGSTIQMEIIGKTLKTEGEDIRIAAFKDITEQKKAEDKLRFQATILDNITDWVTCTDLEGRIIYVNHSVKEISGFEPEELIGKTTIEAYGDSENKKILEREILEIAKIKDWQGELVKKTKTGKEIIINMKTSLVHDKDGKQIGLLGVARDITEQKKLEAELLKAQKLEALGILAGGIAHDFNNLLTGILGNISLAKTYLKPSQEVYERLTQAEKASLQAKNLTQQLLTFAKGGTPIKKTSSVAELVKESAEFALRGSKSNYQFSAPEDLSHVDIDPAQINRVISNIIINSDQAMPDGGTIQIYAENVNIPKKTTIPLKKGKYVKISIQDQGIGIPKEHLTNIFDPYFTTKQKGSGLGLATAYSIINKHDGFLTAESELGSGTTFHIYLPASQKKISKEESQHELQLSGSGRILLMDDDDAVINTAKQMLKYLGYEVELAKDGISAIRIYSKAIEDNQPFEAVIMDLTIPGGLGGKEAVKKILNLNAHAKVIVSSGYSDDPVLANYKKFGFSGYLAKPYSIQDLGIVLKKVLKSPL